jgi:hypothetical protein
VLADFQAPVAERLQDVAVDRPAAERPPARKLAVDADAVPGERIALVPPPLLPPELRVPHQTAQLCSLSILSGDAPKLW